MALDHSRLGLENEFLENKSGQIFCFRQVYWTKYCQQIWVRLNQHFMLFYTSHLRWNSNMRRCFHHTDLRQNVVFHNFPRQIALIQSFSFRTVQSTRGLLTNRSKNSKITYTASRFSLLTSAKFSVNIKRVTFQHNKEYIVFIFYLMVL